MKVEFRMKRVAGLLMIIGIAAVAANFARAQQTITPTALELNKSFDADVSQWTERFEHEGRSIYDHRYDIVNAMNLHPGMHVADIGAGSGLFSRLIAERVGPTGMVYAVDIAKNLVDFIAKTTQELKITNIKPILGDPRSPKLAPASLDLVCIIDSYHHFEFPAEMLAEIKRALKPTGTFVLVDFRRIEGISREHVLKMVRAGKGTFTDEFVNAGFEVVSETPELTDEQYLIRFRHRTETPKPAAAPSSGSAVTPPPAPAHH
jgi:ubiquinone/menaquinone biosynthesis C-methylase UbiE